MATVRQTRALKALSENGGKLGEAMRTAGYTKVTSLSPTKLTDSKGWKELMEKHFPDKKIAELHKKLLNKKEIIVVSDGAKDGSHLEWTGQPHSDAMKALESVYKLKGHYVEPESGNKTLIINISDANAKRYGILPNPSTE